MIVNEAMVRQNRNSAFLLAGAIALFCLLPILVQPDFWPVSTGLALLLFPIIFVFFTQKLRRRHRVLAQPFPTEWEAILRRHVAYYHGLTDEDRARFRRLLQVFLHETPITGVGMVVDETLRVLVGASAVIPIMGFPSWEYTYLAEVLLYPDSFDRKYKVGTGKKARILGMVHGALNNGTVILSAPALRAGFANPRDKRNVGIHEFVHLMDKEDGNIDGISATLPRKMFEPWLALIQEKTGNGKRNRDIDPYAETNDQEFLAVVSEYFFENPETMARKHPKLYEKLKITFNQDPIHMVQGALESIKAPSKWSRNAPCPCGSGTKYKRCCLLKVEQS